MYTAFHINGEYQLAYGSDGYSYWKKNNYEYSIHHFLNNSKSEFDCIYDLLKDVIEHKLSVEVRKNNERIMEFKYGKCISH